MNKNIKPLILIFICFLIINCKKENTDPDNNIPLVFSSLTAARDTIFIEDTTKITAFASGFNLTYNWYVLKGDLLGTGSQITYVATPCTIGDNDIICTVSDGNDNEEIKHVNVTVL
ncbi:hypothetical protein ACFLTI_08380 [Bacteroidota bacterium]